MVRVRGLNGKVFVWIVFALDMHEAMHVHSHEWVGEVESKYRVVLLQRVGQNR